MSNKFNILLSYSVSLKLCSYILLQITPKFSDQASQVKQSSRSVLNDARKSQNSKLDTLAKAQISREESLSTSTPFGFQKGFLLGPALNSSKSSKVQQQALKTSSSESAVSHVNSVSASVSTTEPDVPFIRRAPIAQRHDPLRLDEVQHKMQQAKSILIILIVWKLQGYCIKYITSYIVFINFLCQNLHTTESVLSEWLTNDLLDRVESDEFLGRMMAAPDMPQILSEFQKDPGAAMQKYSHRADVMRMFREFCGMLGDNFTKVAAREDASGAAQRVGNDAP